jgi:hypothetical protein
MNRGYLIILLLIWSCSENEPELNDFEIEVANYYHGDQLDAWVFFHDNDGKLIDQAQFTDGQSLKIPSLVSADKKVSVTLVRILKNLNGDPSFNVESYLNVSFPAKWKLGVFAQYPELACGGVNGQLDLTLEDDQLGNLHDVNVSTLKANHYPNPNESTTSTFKFSPLPIVENCASSFFLYAQDKNGNPKYKFMENVQPGIFTYSLDDFKSFDKVIEVSFPQNAIAYLAVKAFDAGKSIHTEGYLTNSAFGSSFGGIPIASYKVGYLDRFPKYRTTLYARYYKYLEYNFALRHEEVGSAPSSISFDSNFAPEVTNASFSEYSYTTNKPIVFKVISFLYYPALPTTDSYIDWNVFSGGALGKNPKEVPKSFTQKYPNFYLSKLVLGSSSFYTKYNTFDEEIAVRFEGASEKESFVYFGKELYQ